MKTRTKIISLFYHKFQFAYKFNKDLLYILLFNLKLFRSVSLFMATFFISTQEVGRHLYVYGG
jgi:hypothetical protein